jgi:hypothetical protein
VKQPNPVPKGRQKIAQDAVLGKTRQKIKSRRDERDIPRMKSWALFAAQKR